MGETIKDTCKECSSGFSVEKEDWTWKCPVCNTINSTGSGGRDFILPIRWKSKPGQKLTENPHRNRWAAQREREWRKKLRKKGLL